MKKIIAAALLVLAAAGVTQAQSYRRSAAVVVNKPAAVRVVRQAVVINRGLNYGYSHAYVPQTLVVAPVIAPYTAAPAVEAAVPVEPAYTPAPVVTVPYTAAPAFQIVPVYSYSAFSAYRPAVVVRRAIIIRR